jgi:RES domain-containing protein
MASVAPEVQREEGRGGADIPRRRIRWRTSYRIIPSRFPPIDLFERVADAGDLDAVIALESLTNDRLRDEAGDITLVPAAERVVGAGAGYVMAAFTHPHPAGGRFSDARHGAWYAARALATAVAESSHHRAAFLRATREAAMQLDMRVLEAAVDAGLHDVRGLRGSMPAVYDPDDYAASQALARRLRDAGSDGVAYDSVRHAGGQCVAIFRPRHVKRCRETLHLTYVWDGENIVSVYEKRALP